MSLHENSFKIQNRSIGKDFDPFVIVEIGINHEGNYDKAIQMIDDAFESGAECVKFQCHIIEDEMSHHAKDTIPANSNNSILDIMKRCTLRSDEIKRIKEYTESKGMIYLSTPFSRAAADFLEDLGVPAYKIGSGECNNYPLIRHIAKFGKPIILSTGMNNIESIYPAVQILREEKVDFALLHCTSMYPTPYEKVRLAAINQLGENFPDAVLGLSDHSLGNYTCFASIVYGASILEKHFTSDKKWEGPDVSISINPSELKDLIYGSKAIHKSIGGTKEILEEEQPTIDFAYASVVTIKEIKKGEIFSKNNIWVKRPGTGDFLAKEYGSILGKICLHDLETDQQISLRDVEL
jgi:N-acetylneuraminate synthase